MPIIFMNLLIKSCKMLAIGATKFLMHFHDNIQILMDFLMILFGVGLKLGYFVVDYVVLFLED